AAWAGFGRAGHDLAIPGSRNVRAPAPLGDEVQQKSSWHEVNSAAIHTSITGRVGPVAFALFAAVVLVATLASPPRADAQTSSPWSPAAETRSVRILGIGEFS